MSQEPWLSIKVELEGGGGCPGNEVQVNGPVIHVHCTSVTSGIYCRLPPFHRSRSRSRFLKGGHTTKKDKGGRHTTKPEWYIYRHGDKKKGRTRPFLQPPRPTNAVCPPPPPPPPRHTLAGCEWTTFVPIPLDDPIAQIFTGFSSYYADSWSVHRQIPKATSQVTHKDSV